jgi:hypothetical protein
LDRRVIATGRSGQRRFEVGLNPAVTIRDDINGVVTGTNTRWARLPGRWLKCLVGKRLSGKLAGYFTQGFSSRLTHFLVVAAGVHTKSRFNLSGFEHPGGRPAFAFILNGPR